MAIYKNLKKNNNVLMAISIDNGIAISSKVKNGYYADAVVYLQGNPDGTTTLYINEDKLEALKCTVVYQKFNESA